MTALPEDIWRRRLESEYDEMRSSGEKFEVNADKTEYTLRLTAPALHREDGEVLKRDQHVVRIDVARVYPYAGGIDITWLTPVFHPNIREADGKVCIQLVNDWAENQTLASVVQALRHLLAHPNVDDPLDKEAAAWFKENPGALDGVELVQKKKPRIVSTR